MKQPFLFNPKLLHAGLEVSDEDSTGSMMMETRISSLRFLHENLLSADIRFADTVFSRQNGYAACCLVRQLLGIVSFKCRIFLCQVTLQVPLQNSTLGILFAEGGNFFGL